MSNTAPVNPTSHWTPRELLKMDYGISFDDVADDDLYQACLDHIARARYNIGMEEPHYQFPTQEMIDALPEFLRDKIGMVEVPYTIPRTDESLATYLYDNAHKPQRPGSCCYYCGASWLGDDSICPHCDQPAEPCRVTWDGEDWS